MTEARASVLLQHVQPETFLLTYPDIRLGGYRTATFYVGDRSAPVNYFVKQNGRFSQSMISNIKFDFVEV
jgi:hypothetical protein